MDKLFGKSLLAIFTVLALSSEGQSQQIVLEDSMGENYVIEIESQQSFFEVIDSIDQYLMVMDSVEKGNYENSELPQRAFQMNFKISDQGILVKASKKKSQAPRSYFTSANQQEKADIGYIVKTLADNSLIKIKSSESSLKKAGDRITHIHPFQFLITVFQDEQLKVCMRNLQGKSWVWKSFLEGITDTLAEENNVNNLLPYAEDFAARININSNVFLPTLQSAKWQKFIEVLIDNVPRNGEAGRYGM